MYMLYIIFLKFIYLLACRCVQCCLQANRYVNSISSILSDITIFSSEGGTHKTIATDGDVVSMFVLYTSTVYIVNKCALYFLMHLCKHHIFLYFYVKG